jgi:hypothetical protein
VAFRSFLRRKLTLTFTGHQIRMRLAGLHGRPLLKIQKAGLLKLLGGFHAGKSIEEVYQECILKRKIRRIRVGPDVQ